MLWLVLMKEDLEDHRMSGPSQISSESGPVSLLGNIECQLYYHVYVHGCYAAGYQLPMS